MTKEYGVVLVGGLGEVGGYFAASAFSYLLVPTYSWRILWLINLPTGLLLVLLGGDFPFLERRSESAKTVKSL